MTWSAGFCFKALKCIILQTSQMITALAVAAWEWGCYMFTNIDGAVFVNRNSITEFCFHLKMTFRKMQHFTSEPGGLESPQQDLPRRTLCLQGRTSGPWVERRQIVRHREGYTAEDSRIALFSAAQRPCFRPEPRIVAKQR